MLFQARSRSTHIRKNGCDFHKDGFEIRENILKQSKRKIVIRLITVVRERHMLSISDNAYSECCSFVATDYANRSK